MDTKGTMATMGIPLVETATHTKPMALKPYIIHQLQRHGHDIPSNSKPRNLIAVRLLWQSGDQPNPEDGHFSIIPLCWMWVFP